MLETMVGVELLEGYKRVVCDTCRYSIFLIKFHGEFHLSSVTQGFHTTIAKGFFVWRDSKEKVRAL